MHFALPPRKTSNPPPYARASRTSSVRKQRLKYGLIAGCVFILLVCLLKWTSSGSGEEPIPPGTPEVVIVTLLDEKSGQRYITKIKKNREDYASRHGYLNFYANASDYNIGGSPRSWALVPALRHALTVHPHSTYFFSLSPHSLIMNPTLPLTSHVVSASKLESLMLKDIPVVPPDSVIHTFSHLKGHNIDLVLTQDGEGLCPESFVLRQSEWSRFFLDTWFDPLYRSYNFQRAEGHALEHIVQWHPTILAKLALIPQRTINSYTVDIASRGGRKVTYEKDDFIVRAVGCESDANRHCEQEMDPWYNQWLNQYGQVT
ncbi:hypothetical protein MMC25_005306 [Agyrium rufum]|nr:hypothetical protein [Agyrium rufum]